MCYIFQDNKIIICTDPVIAITIIIIGVVDNFLCPVVMTMCVS